MMSWFPGPEVRIACNVRPCPVDDDLGPDAHAIVDRLWEPIRRDETGYDSSILHCSGVQLVGNTLNIECRPCSYRLFAIGLRHPETGIRVNPLAVSGIVSVGTGSAEQLLVGRRPAGVRQFPGHLELVASGGVSSDDVLPSGAVAVVPRFIQECVEELGWNTPPSVSSAHLIGVVYGDSTVDLIVRGHIAAHPGAPVRQATSSVTDRYDAVQTIPMRSSGDYLRQHAKELVPTSAVLLKLLATASRYVWDTTRE